MKHTVEPWVLGQKLGRESFCIWAGKLRIAWIDFWGDQIQTGNTKSEEEQKANGDRIVACVNFCQGVPNDQMHPGRLGLLIDKATQQDEELSRLRSEREELRMALQRILDTLDSEDPNPSVSLRADAKKAKAVLSRLEGGGK